MSYSYLWHSTLSFSKQTVREPGNGPDKNLSLQTETTQPKRLRLHCKIPPSADNLSERSVENMGKVMSCPTLLGWCFQLCPPFDYPPRQSQQPCPPATPAPERAVTLDLRVSCDGYFCCVCFLMS